MKLFLKAQLIQLFANSRINKERRNNGQTELDFSPVVKLFTPDAGATWLLTEIDPDEPDMAFGLCDLGLGLPKVGHISLPELAEVRGALGLEVEQDQHFRATGPLSMYAENARKKSGVT